jgi:citrate synthase
MATSLSQGMEDVVAAESAITWIDGKTGQLRYRGYPIGELADRCTFEQVVYLLWHGELPTEKELARLRESLRSFRMDYGSLLGLIKTVPKRAHPLDVLRFCVSRDALDNPLSADNSREANWTKSMQFVAWFPVIAAGFHRIRQGKVPVPPRPDLDTAASFLSMLRGSEPDPVAVRTLDMSLVLHADHELNASTFAARVTIATQSNLHAAIASALGTLAGPRHGGASDRVIHMLEEIGSPDRAESWALEQLAQRQRIMGFGHRVYRTIDPRSRHLRLMAEKLLEGTDHTSWSETLQRLSTVMERERSLYPNVDLYAAVVNHELGIDPAFYTSIFACSRVAGWTAHAVEQLDGRMIRPIAEYVGPGPRSLAAEALV